MAKLIGLTGGIATGKSTVSEMFRSEGIPVIDADEIAKEEIKKGKDAYKEIHALFGDEILATDGEINRNKLARKLFFDIAARKKINEIVHPRVKRIVMNEVKHLEDYDTPIIVLDVPLLFETDFHKLVDISVLVYARRKDQIERIVARENIDEDYARKKIRAQMPITKKRELADYVIDNSKNIIETRKSYQRVLKKIRRSLDT